MKTKKEGLNLNKFIISKLNNLTYIRGGDGDDHTNHTDIETIQGSTNMCNTITR